MIVSIVAALASNNVIGNAGRLVWNIPTDMKWFRQLTSKKTVIMGRKTFDSIGKPLPNRRNIVITRQVQGLDSDALMLTQKLFNPPLGIELSPSLSQAIKTVSNDEEVFIIGGAQIYNEAINIADQMYLTHVLTEIDGDTLFPSFSKNEWEVISTITPNQQPEDQFAIEVKTYKRRTNE